ncbi:class I SAM-dependent methyltransferase [Acidiplasma aeolicum]|jgi:ubiquinone/menaquinone biosynthesis C-methylase UbiE|uniref:SAM-dependent methyltransferase n=1 Tax=Acidiplasma aeolicum TaxID=507754 RepID=A0A0Q1B155_9ARCH|nr:methyltransferase domain-containing protein [Acidiplasma aeolicum]KQB33466.1 SAM-dependent methyltransferase [Acidiplasma aeolicum]
MNEPAMGKIMDKIKPLIIGNNILDIGTGFGTVIKALIKNEDMSITSIDPEMWRFEQLKNTFLDEIYKNRLKLLKLSIEETGFRDKQFTTSISLFSAHHFTDPIRAMNEIDRITSNAIIIADWSPGSSGISNPHTPEELQLSMDIIINYAMGHGYRINNHKMWYSVYRKK